MSGWLTALKSSWHRSLSLVWLWIIALQWLSYTEPLWLRQTTASVLIVLTAVVIFEIIFPVRLLVRLAAEGLLILFLLYRILVHYGLYLSNPYLTWQENLETLAAHSIPYIWFALGAWLCLLAAAWWVRSKRRILVFIGLNIVGFAILDSFTSSELWQEVAWSVFAGMCWLVTDHLRNFQKRYPQGWKYLRNYPFKVALNIAIIFSLIIMTGVSMPEVRPTLTDPYTAWREWRGEGVSFIGSGGTGTSSGSGGSSSEVKRTSSGYSRQDNRLGGGFTFDYSPVMSVTSDLRTYWRGETRTLYSGTGWLDNNRNRRGSLTETQVGDSLENGESSRLETQKLQQTVTMLNNNDYPVLFGAYAMTSVDSIDGEKEGEGLYWRSRQAEMLWNPDDDGGGYPKTYTVTSEVPIIPVDEIRTRTYEQLYGAGEVDDIYLQLPSDFPQRVKDLAEEITASADTPYEKTALLQQYLQQTYSYTNEPDLSKRSSPDFVESFLFEVMEGYCDYYSTAMVTMARSLDIPARWVKGYAPGNQAEVPDNLMIRNGVSNNSYTVTNADAHSWAEVYFGEYGWIPVEATPGFDMPLLTETDTSEPVTDTPEDEEEPAPKPEAEPAAPVEDQSPIGVWVVAAAAAVLLGWLGYQLWRYRLKLRYLLLRLRIGETPSPAQKVIFETERWLKYMRRKGMPKEGHETLRESVSRWSRERPEATGALSPLLSLFEKASYSPEAVQDGDWRKVYDHALQLRKSLKGTR